MRTAVTGKAVIKFYGFISSTPFLARTEKGLEGHRAGWGRNRQKRGWIEGANLCAFHRKVFMEMNLLCFKIPPCARDPHQNIQPFTAMSVKLCL